jgi:drug/metabolite transporter (DMT)-like permease
MNNTATNKHYMGLPIALIMLASAPILIRLSNIHFLSLISWRLVFVCALLFIINFKFPIKTISFKQKKEIAIVGIFLFCHFITWVIAIRNLPISVATIIYATNPITTAVFAKIILKEKYHLRYFISLLISMVGIVIIANLKGSTIAVTAYGITAIILSASFYSLYMVLSKKIRKSIDNTTYSFYLNATASIIGFSYLLINNIFLENPIDIVSFSNIEWLYILLLAIFPSLLGHTLLIYLVHFFNLNWVSIFKLINPLISSFFAYIFFKESFTPTHWLAFSFILIGLINSFDLKRLYEKGN